MINFYEFKMIPIFLFILLGLISYEIHFYLNFYYYLSFLSFFSLIFLLKEKNTKYFFEKNIGLLGLLGFYLFSIVVSSVVKLDIIGLARSFFTIFVIFIILLVLSKQDISKIFKILGFLGGILASLSILIEFGIVSTWNHVVERNASIFFDPNYAGTILGVCFFSIIIFNKNLYYKLFFCSLILISIFLTFSKSVLLAIILSLFFSLIRKKLFFSIFSMIILFSLGYFIYLSVDFTMFRLEQSFNNRDIMWEFVLNRVFNEQFLFGFGEQGLAEELVNNGLVNSSTHNTFMDILGKYGILSLAFYCFFVLYGLLKAFINNHKILPLLIFLFVTSNSITYTIGGIGFLSIIFALCVFSIFFYKKKLISREIK